jgi:molecular chaperone GrpE (heat shock protein)
MPTEQNTLTPVAVQPDVTTARAALSKLETERAAVAERIYAGRRTTDVIAALDAKAAEDGLMDTVHRLDAEIEKARAALDDVTARAKVRVNDAFVQTIRPVVARLVRALEDARAINDELSAMEIAQHSATGIYLDPLAWSQLLPSDSLRTSRLDEWKANAIERGLLDD